MTPQTSLDELVADILALDPSLTPHEAEVRTLVATLITKKPTVAIDTTFLTNLRAQLVTPTTPRASVPTHSLSWYFVRFAPIGAVALLLLMLVPQPAHSPIPESTPQMYEMTVEDTSTLTSPTMKMATPASDDAVSLMATSETLDAVPVDSFTFDALRPGTTFSVLSADIIAPSFIVIHTAPLPERGTIIGQSELLNPGLSTDLVIPLTESPIVDTLYYVTLYRDDGDTQFMETLDIPAYDTAGNPISITIIGARE